MTPGMAQQEVKVIDTVYKDEFESQVNNLLGQGWQIISCNTGITNTQPFESIPHYQAIMVKMADAIFI